MKEDNKFKKIFYKLIRLRYNILAVPKEGSSGKRVYKIDLYKFVTFFVIFVVIAHFIFLALLVYTPIRNYLPGFDIVTTKESQQLVDLKNKLEQFNNEYERMRFTNYRLNLLIQGKPIPYDKRMLDSMYMKEKYLKDSANLISNIPYGNNLYKGYEKFKETEFYSSIINFINNIISSEGNDTTKYLQNKIFYIPVVGVLTQNFTPEKGHNGIDFGVKSGTIVRATASGVVIFSDYTINEGYKIIISHGNGYTSVYKHLSVVLKKEREVVSQNEVIALSGDTGELSYKPHLHFEIWKNNIPINPLTICVDYNEH